MIQYERKRSADDVHEPDRSLNGSHPSIAINFACGLLQRCVNPPINQSFNAMKKNARTRTHKMQE
eukprot:m.76579 g.76579  ORF g.76579 m.76579 type:complete len:65 (+) comp12489_c0_seq5:428-622(+)